jgi:hypothetical protein
MHPRTVPLPLAATAALALTAAGCGSDDAVTHAKPPLDPPLATPAERPGKAAGRTHAEEARVVQLGTPRPSRFPAGSPGRAAAGFLLAWHDRAWDRAADWTAPSWRYVAHDRGVVLRRRYGARRLRGGDVGLVRRTSPATARVPVRLASRRAGHPDIDRTRLTLRLVREDAHGRPVRSGGRWGVLPPATIGTDDEDATTR